MQKFRSILFVLLVVASSSSLGLAQYDESDTPIVITTKHTKIEYEDGTKAVVYAGAAFFDLGRKDGKVRVNWEKRGHLAEDVLRSADEDITEETLRAYKKLPHRSTAIRHANALVANSDFESALKYFEIAYELEVDRFSMCTLGWILATCPEESVRDAKRALILAKEACEVTNWEDSGMIGCLAAAYAENGDLEAAKKWIQKALLMDTKFRKIRIKMLESFQNGKPYRQQHRYVAS